MSDALDKLGLPGAVTGIQRLTTLRRISGRVHTVRMDKDDGTPSTRHLGTTAIEASGPGDVIVMEQRTGIEAACWGGNLSFGAQLRQVAGVIVDGPVRDVDEARDYDFPVFARHGNDPDGAGPHPGGRDGRADHGRRRHRFSRSTSSSPTAAASCSSPQADIVRVLEAAEAIAARERAMVAALEEGTPISVVMGRNYETMLKK